MSTGGAVPIPGALLQAVAQRTGRVTIVVGAGCSLEEPTGLKLGGDYSNEAFQQLVLDHMIEPSECPNPWDLSELATAVNQKYGSQAALVERLPRDKYQFARPNLGYLLVAALIAEGSVACVATLNFDLALSHAIAEVQPQGVSQVAGPESYGDFGSKAIVYLHRNVNEQNPDLWILRREAIEDEWRHGWEAVAAQRIAAAPVVVFAGLGSPALVLTETITRVRQLVPDSTLAFLVDPGATSAFATAVNVVNPDHHIKLGWGDFMSELAMRLVAQFGLDIRRECDSLAHDHALENYEAPVDRLIATLMALGLLRLGGLRALWLGSKLPYEPDAPSQRAILADLLLGLSLLLRSAGCALSVNIQGSINIAPPGSPSIVVRPASGCGVKPWGAVDQLAAKCGSAGADATDVILVAGFRGRRPADVVPPLDITGATSNDDITVGHRVPRILDVDDLREDPELAAELGL